MPFKSKAQRRKFAELLVEGEITPEQYERWNKETGSRTLPERAHTKNTKKRTSRQKRTKKKTTKKKVTKK